jgi:mannan endo-1,4-beta-mannosidase
LDTGSDGSYPYTYAEGLDFAKNLGIKTIDFGTFHLYPSTCMFPAPLPLAISGSSTVLVYANVTTQGGVANSFGNGYITAHAKACAAAQKPCLMEEYGVTSDKCNIEVQWQRTALSAKGIGADLYWQCGDKLSTGNSPDDEFTVYYGSDDFKCVVTDHVAGI